MKFQMKDYSDLKERVQAMDVRELIDMVCVPHFEPTKKEELYKSVIFFIHQGTAGAIEAKRQQLTEYKGSEPLFVSDFEYGCGHMIDGSVKFPSMYAFGQTEDPELIYEIGRGVADEGRRYGYAWSFSPCVDILMNTDCPIASIRAAGDNADRVIQTAGAYMKGMQDSGMAATLKHFPGDGATLYDQHLTTTENPLSLEEWWASYGKVYRTLIEEGAMSVMPGHIALPCYDDADENGLYPPATLSHKLLTDLLKGELGFEGIIVSDAVNMGGFCGYQNFYEACAGFLTAGGDMLLFVNPEEKFYRAFEGFVANGSLLLEVLRDRAYRACCFVRYCQTEMLTKKHSFVDMAALEKKVAERSVEIFRDRKHILPYSLTQDTRILHVAIVNETDGYRPYLDLDKKLHEISDNVTTLIDPGCDRLRKDAENAAYDLIVCSIASRISYGLNSARISGAIARNMMGGWMKLGVPTVFVNYSHPYLYREYNSSMDTLIHTYGDSASTADVVCKLLFGK